MPRSNNDDLVSLIKEIAVNSIKATNPSEFYYGTVIATNPLKVQVSSNLILEEPFLVVPKHLTDYEVEVTMNWNTEIVDTDHTHDITFSDRYNSSGDSISKTVTSKSQNSNSTHSHNLKGEKILTVHNSLKINEKVILARVQGGQEYIIQDKVG